MRSRQRAHDHVGALDGSLEAEGAEHRSAGGDAQVYLRSKGLEQPVDSLALDAGHRFDLLGAVLAIENENRVN